MQAQPSPNVRTAPGRGPNAEGYAEIGNSKDSQPETIRQYDDWIETAEEYERMLALKAYRVRKLILNLKCKRDALEALGAVLEERRVAA